MYYNSFLLTSLLSLHNFDRKSLPHQKGDKFYCIYLSLDAVLSLQLQLCFLTISVRLNELEIIVKSLKKRRVSFSVTLSDRKVPNSLRDRRSKWKGKGIRTREGQEKRGTPATRLGKGNTLDIQIWVRGKIARKEMILVRQDTASVSRPTLK